MDTREFPDSANADPHPDSVEVCVAERLLLDENLQEAVRDRRVVRFSYGSRHYEVEPHAYGVQPDGEAELLAYETAAGAGGGQRREWLEFRLADIKHLVFTDRPWAGQYIPIDCPIAVTFARSPDVSVKSAASDTLRASPEDVARLRKVVDEAVEGLRDQMFELCRLEAHRVELEKKLEELDEPVLVEELGVLKEQQERTREIFRDLIPKVAELQKRLLPPTG